MPIEKELEEISSELQTQGVRNVKLTFSPGVSVEQAKQAASDVLRKFLNNEIVEDTVLDSSVMT